MLKDYKGQKVMIDEKVFETHTTGSHALRAELLDAVPEILKHPDEVWLNDYMGAFKNLNFIRFYKGHAIDAVCEVNDMLEYRVTTWFEIPIHPKIKEKTRRSRRIDPRWRYRRGLLIKK